jgi:hypothetical protein
VLRLNLKTLLAFAVAVALIGGCVILLGGCGGGDDGGNGGTAETPSKEAQAPTTQTTETEQGALTKAQFVKLADAICGRNFQTRSSELLKFARKVKSETQETAERAVAEIFLPTYHRELKELEALAVRGTPEGDEAQVTAILEAFAESVEEAEANPVVVVSGANKPLEEARRLASEYGLKNCPEY